MTNYGFLLYTAFGGPDSVHQVYYSGNLIAYDSSDQKKQKFLLIFNPSLIAICSIMTKQPRPI